MAEFLLRYADPRGQMHEQVAEAPSEREARERLSQQGYLVYSVRAKDLGARLSGMTQRRKTVNLEKFLVFNQQFVTLIKAGLPILQGLDLLADKLTDEEARPSHTRSTRRSKDWDRAFRRLCEPAGFSFHLRHFRACW